MSRLAWWEDLGPWARVSLAGILAASLLALGLGWYIPDQVEQQFLQAQMDSDQSILDVLSSTDALIPNSDADLESLDDFVHQAVLRGDFVRAKLWTLDGTVLYSDEPLLIGRSYEPDHEFEEVRITQQPVSHISTLDDAENEFEQGIEGPLLETYLPVEQNGEVVAVWEVYRSLEGLNSAVSGVRTAVWGSVALGLGILAIFLVSAYGGLISSVQRRRRDAEARSQELGTLLELARTTIQTLDPTVLAEETVRLVCESGSYQMVRLTSELEGTAEVLAETGIDGEGGWEHAEVGATSDQGVVRLAGLRGDDQHMASTLLEAALEEYRIGADRAALYRHLEDSRAQLASVMERLVVAQEDERQRIVGEVHDGLGQDLHRILFSIRGSRGATDSDMRTELETLEEIVTESSRRLRRLLQELHPSTIDDIGLVASVRGLIERMHEDYGLNVDLHLDMSEEPAIPQRTALFRITQEALQNVVKHAGTLSADVRITRQNGSIELRVADAGAGMVPKEKPGLGLWLMEERARSVGGTVVFDSGAAGTSVTARIPMEAS